MHISSKSDLSQCSFPPLPILVHELLFTVLFILTLCMCGLFSINKDSLLDFNEASWENPGPCDNKNERTVLSFLEDLLIDEEMMLGLSSSS